MDAPSWACRSLYRLHKQLRLAWAGRERAYPGELNPGDYAIVQLYHISDCGKYDEPTTFREFWDVTLAPTAYGEPEVVRANRGPIFNRDGGYSRDWNPDLRRAIFVTTVDFDKVQSGAFLVDVEHWLTDIKERIRKQRLEKGKNMLAHIDGMTEEMTDRLWRDAQSSTATRTEVPYEFRKKEIEQMHRKRDLKRKYLENAFGVR